MARWAVTGTLLLIASFSLSDGRSGGRPVVYTSEKDVTLPDVWRTPTIKGRLIPLDLGEVSRSRAVVAQAISLYPQNVLDENLNSVYVVKELWFYGVKFGGTNSRSSVYIANRGINQGFTDDYLASTFHHEFSSILLRNHYQLFEEGLWLSANKPGDQYRKTGTQSLIEGTADTRFRGKYHMSGFLNQYGTSSLEEDFNTYAEALFCGGPRFWHIVDNYPRVAAKKDVVVAFYQALHPQFTEDFFRSLAK